MTKSLGGPIFTELHREVLTAWFAKDFVCLPPPVPKAHFTGSPPETEILLFGSPMSFLVKMTTLPPAPLPPGADL